MLMLSFLLPKCLAVSVDGENAWHRYVHTFYRVRLHKLSTVNEQGLWDGVPCHALRHSHVNVCGRQLVDVEPDVLRPSILDQVLI